MLTASEISTLIDECLQKERAALDFGNNEDAQFYTKVWGILIKEMQNREI